MKITSSGIHHFATRVAKSEISFPAYFSIGRGVLLPFGGRIAITIGCLPVSEWRTRNRSARHAQLDA
jgi:hypothetical protein